MFKELVERKAPLPVVGVMNPYIAMLAMQAGFEALYLSGSGVATFSHGLPDLGVISREQVVDEVLRISSAAPLPLLVDIDTGYGSPLALKQAIRLLEKVGAAAVHLEDQAGAKRCGHREGKKLCSQEEMCARIRIASASRSDAGFVIMARTDSIESEGVDGALRRSEAYLEAGADMLFIEALQNPADYPRFKALGAPILANMTEFGKTPLLSLDELGALGVDIVLYPLTIARVMNKAAVESLNTLLKERSQKSLLPRMQTRSELYETLNYEKSEVASWET